jgi:hypothetical protein
MRVGQKALFKSVEVGDIVCDPSIDPPDPCQVIEKQAEDQWIILECDGAQRRLTYDEYNDLGYVFLKLKNA